MIADLRKRLRSKETPPHKAVLELMSIIPTLSKLNNVDDETTFRMLIGDPQLGPILLDAEHLMGKYLQENPYPKGKDGQEQATRDREMFENIRTWRQNLRSENEANVRRA